MRIREHLTRTLLTSAVIAGPAILGNQLFTMADDGASLLKPAGSEVALRQVPESLSEASTVQQVGFRDGNTDHQTSTVNAELEQVFQKNGQTMPSMHVGSLPNVKLPKIRLVQHAADDGNDRKSDQSEPAKVKKPGLFRRLFGQLVTTDDEGGQSAGSETPANSGGAQGESNGGKDNPYLNSGEPVGRLPAPPPITYQTQNKSVQAKPTSHPQNNAVRPLIQNSSVQSAARPGNVTSEGAQRPSQRNEGFINPFKDQEMTRQEEVYLDLDSLIEETDSATEASQKRDSRDSSAVQEEEIPELIVKPARSAQPSPDDDEQSPFTGYRLSADETAATPSNQNANTDVRQQSSTNHREADPSKTETSFEDTIDLSVPLIEDVDVESSEAVFDSPPTHNSAGVTTEESNSFEQIPLLETNGRQRFQPNTKASSETRTFDRFAETETADSAAAAAVQQINKPAIPGAGSIRALDSRVRQEQQRYRIMSRTGVAGFKGFCPVTLRDQRDLIDSREEYRAKFGLQTYYFATPEAKSAFEANPARYAPAAGGSDVVLLVNTGEDAAGTLDFSLWYRDRLYMFRSRETQAIFSKDPTRYADQY